MSRRNKPGNGHLCLAGYWHPDGSHGVKNQFRIDDDITVTIGRVTLQDNGRFRVEMVFHAPDNVEIWRETVYRNMQP